MEKFHLKQPPQRQSLARADGFQVDPSGQALFAHFELNQAGRQASGVNRRVDLAEQVG